METIIDIITSETGIQIIIGFIVSILGMTKLSKQTVERIDDILSRWGPIVVREIEQQFSKDLSENGRTDVTKKVMKAAAVEKMKSKLPPVLRKMPRVNERIDSVIESSVSDLKHLRKFGGGAIAKKLLTK